MRPEIRKVVEADPLVFDDLPPINQWDAELGAAIITKILNKQVHHTDYRLIALSLAEAYIDEFNHNQRMIRNVQDALYSKE